MGEQLPPGRDLAVRMGVSRPVLREAVEQLQAVGVLESRRGNGGGVFVRSLTLPTHLLTDRTLLDDPRDLVEVLEARRTIETSCHLLAASGRGPTICGRWPGSWQTWRRRPATRGVHRDGRALPPAGGGRPRKTRRWPAFLAEIFRDLASVRTRYPTGYGSMEAAIGYQRRSLEAIRSGDPESCAPRPTTTWPGSRSTSSAIAWRKRRCLGIDRRRLHEVDRMAAAGLDHALEGRLGVEVVPLDVVADPARCGDADARRLANWP